MKRLAVGMSLALLVGSLAPAAAQTPFPDIAPCHWAADAVTEIAGEPDVSIEQAMASRYLAENSIRQVFEGLQCETPGWSQAFVVNEPTEWPAAVGLENFQLSVDQLDLSGDTASAVVTVNATVGGGESFQRTGELELRFAERMWLVEYGSLSTLGLPLFP